MIDPRAIQAAHNNADWYAMMFDIHGLRYKRDATSFVALDPPPKFHSWMTTFGRRPSPALMETIRFHADNPDFGIKDAFDILDLDAEGLTELFAATWIWTDALPYADTPGWERIETPQALLAFETAWADGVAPGTDRHFPDAILLRNDIALWGRRGTRGYDAGVIANLSEDCVGMSNCFGTEAMASAARLCLSFGGGLPLVGYERGDDLREALEAGMITTGPLRIWHRV